jgi:hypothetical protein
MHRTHIHSVQVGQRVAVEAQKHMDEIEQLESTHQERIRSLAAEFKQKESELRRQIAVSISTYVDQSPLFETARLDGHTADREEHEPRGKPLINLRTLLSRTALSPLSFQPPFSFRIFHCHWEVAEALCFRCRR